VKTPLNIDQNKKGEVKLYMVPVNASIQPMLSGWVPIYATDESEAAAKLQVQIEAEAVDDDIEMEDSDSAFTISFGEMVRCFGNVAEIDEADIQVDDQYDVDPAAVLRADIVQLELQIAWDSETLAKRKTFLESLLPKEMAA
jgi:hypothetical protein